MADKIDCLLISTGRAGSTGLYHYMNNSGLLNLPDNKEPHHLIDNLETIEGVYEKLLSLYVKDKKKYFSAYKNSKTHLDASVGYFFYIDKVIEKLKRYDQNPKVIFLYRSPHSRARSLFNELKKKGLTDSNDFYSDLSCKKPYDMWWESYYDNVSYDDVLLKISDFFNDILIVSYDEFAKNPKEITRKALAFINKDVKLSNINFNPVNSSNEAIVTERYGFLSIFGKVFPRQMRRSIKIRLGRFLINDDNEEIADGHLNYSKKQYDQMIKKIKLKEYLCLKKL